MKGTRTDLESRADLVEWNLIQSSWGKGRWRLWNKQVNQKSNEDWKQHIPNQHCEWRAFTPETSLSTAWYILEVFWTYTVYSIAVSLLAWWQTEDIKPHWAALLMQSGEKSTLTGHWSLRALSLHTHTHTLAERGKGSPMWARPQQTHGNLWNYTGRRRHFTACLQPDPSYTLVAHYDPK